MKGKKQKRLTLKEIEDFILAGGSDDIPVFGGTHVGGLHCQQVPDELAPCLFDILESGWPVKSYLEIGVAAGGTTFLVHHFLAPETIVLVDDGKHHKAGLRPEILKDIPRREIVGRSDDPDVFLEAQRLGPYDLILIDGDHLYPGVKLDTLLYSPLLIAGGFLVFHDSALPQWGVCRVVRELRSDPSWEFVGEYLSLTHHRPLGLATFRRVK